jgi:hypothetical protein
MQTLLSKIDALQNKAIQLHPIFFLMLLLLQQRNLKVVAILGGMWGKESVWIC